MAGKDLSAERLHPFNIVGIDHADIAASFQTGLIGEAGKIVDNTAVLFESPVNRDVLKAAYVTEASCKEMSPFLGVFPKIVDISVTDCTVTTPVILRILKFTVILWS